MPAAGHRALCAGALGGTWSGQGPGLIGGLLYVEEAALVSATRVPAEPAHPPAAVGPTGAVGLSLATCE